MFRYGRKLDEERQYYEELLARSEQRQTTNLIVGLIVGAAAGYCAKKYVVPKLAEIEYKEKLDQETEALKERFNDLKYSVLSLKDKIHFPGCCCDEDYEMTCCCGDECDDETCCDDDCCEEKTGCCNEEAVEETEDESSEDESEEETEEK